MYKFTFIIIASTIFSGLFPLKPANHIIPLKHRPDTNRVDDYFKENFFRYEDRTYGENIKTAILHLADYQLAAPVIDMNSEQKLKLSFDDIDADIKNYVFTIIHCSSDWQPSAIEQHEYIKGFTENPITDYKRSFNTLRAYTHYNLLFPDDNFSITKSGNYVIKVYPEGKEDMPVISKRFMIVDNKVKISSTVKMASSMDDRNYKQEIDFVINHEGYDITDPYGSLRVIIMQNSRYDNAITDLKPILVRDKELIYDYDEDNVFIAGNEYRFFDIKNFSYLSERVQNIKYDSSGHQVYLFNDDTRSFKRYLTVTDINGRFFIKADNTNDSEVEADYAFVHFSLPFEAPVIEGNIYIFGALTQWNFLKVSQMKYNYKEKIYETTLMLKQGYYNYEYVFLKDGQKAGDNSIIEGSHFGTENEYYIYVYHKPFGSEYDQLIGFSKKSTR